MEITKIKSASWNPRSMSAQAKETLKKSLEEFQDISGITINKKTGNIIAGNHRWEILCKKYKKEKLTFKQIEKSEFSMLYCEKKFTGMIVRFVEWDKTKEKSANVMANSSYAQGEFTSGLQDVLSELNKSLSESLFKELKFEDMFVHVDGISDGIIGDDSDVRNEKAKKSKEEDEEEVKPKKKKEEDQILNKSINILVPSDLSNEVYSDITTYLSKKRYYGNIAVTLGN